MAQPVWTLSVDLQTKTATFTTGLADAAKGARGSFNDIKQGAQDMGRETNVSMTEARHGVMLLGEEFGVHLPRALTSFISSIGPVGAAMEAAFPFLAIIVGATLLLEHLAKIREEGGKLTESQVNFGTTVNNVLDALNDKLLQAGIRSDELNHNHLGALNKQLELIDHQSMAELVQAFGVVSKAADLTFAQLKTSWFQWGSGAAGAKNALEQFKTQYDSLLAQSKDGAASDLLAGTLQSAQRVLALQKQAHDNESHKGAAGTSDSLGKFAEAQQALKKQNIGYSEKEVEAQQTLVEALQAQVNVQSKVNELKSAQKGNAEDTAQKGMDGDADKRTREQAQEQAKADEEAAKLQEERYRTAVSAIQENERLKIDATKQGSSARLAAIDAAIQDENGKGLQETGFYKSLLVSRVDTARQFSDEEKKIRADAGKEAADHDEKMAELDAAANRDADQLKMSSLRNSMQARLQSELQFANAEFAAKQQAASKEIAALEKTDKDYENKVKAINDKQLELTRQYENQITQIKSKAEEERNTRILSASNRLNDSLASGMASVLTRQESMAKMMVSLGDQIAAGMIQNAIKSILANDMTKEHDAAAAARKAFLAGEDTAPGIAGVILGGVMGAAAFASVMAFQDGGIVPGVGRGDTVPSMLEPGEGVLTNKQMDGINYRAKFGGDNSGGDVHVHHHAVYNVQAFNSDGVNQVLKDHGDKFVRHATDHIRKMNK